MKLARVFLGILMTSSALVVSAKEIHKPETVEVSGKIDWVYDYQKGMKLSESTGRPMFVVFRCER